MRVRRLQEDRLVILDASILARAPTDFRNSVRLSSFRNFRPHPSAIKEVQPGYRDGDVREKFKAVSLVI